MDPEVLSQAVDQLGCGEATAKLLTQLGVRVVGDIVKLTPYDVLARPHGTLSALREIQERLGERGLALSNPQPGQAPVPQGIDDSDWGCLFVLPPDADEGAPELRVRQAVIEAYGRTGAEPVTVPVEAFTPWPLERQMAGVLGEDELFITGGPVGWVPVMSHRWEWAPAGNHPLALALSERMTVLSLTHAPQVYREISLYEAGKLNSMITLGPEAPRVPPELPALDLVPLAKRAGVPMSLLRKGLHASHRTFINLAGLAWESTVGFRRGLGGGGSRWAEDTLVFRKPVRGA